MRILHVWDHSGVSGVMAKYQRQLNHLVEVVKRKGYDKYGIGEFYEIKQIGTPKTKGLRNLWGSIKFYWAIIRNPWTWSICY